MLAVENTILLFNIHKLSSQKTDQPNLPRKVCFLIDLFTIHSFCQLFIVHCSISHLSAPSSLQKRSHILESYPSKFPLFQDLPHIVFLLSE